MSRIALLLFASSLSHAADLPTQNVNPQVGEEVSAIEPEKNSLLSINKRRSQITKAGMLTLGGWAAANIGTGLALSSSSEGVKKRFWQMNTYWNLVNLGIAGYAYYHESTRDQPNTKLAETVSEIKNLEMILALNLGLDVAYMVAGGMMINRSKFSASNADKWKGYGQSLLLQGGFLFALDLTMLIFQRCNSSGLNQALKGVVVSQNFVGYRWAI